MLNPAVQFTHPTPHVGESTQTAGQRRGHNIADQLVVGRGQQPSRGHRVGHTLGVGDPAQLKVGTGGQLQGSGGEPGGGIGERIELGRGDHPAGKPDTGQRTIGGLMGLQRAGAGVVLARSGHASTVRRGRG